MINEESMDSTVFVTSFEKSFLVVVKREAWDQVIAEMMLLLRTSSASSKNEFKDFWLNIKPISEWYSLDKNGYSKAYINKYNSQNGIYIFRSIEEPWKCYVGSAESFSLLA